MSSVSSVCVPGSRVLVTGARGFVGSALCRGLRDRRYVVSEGQRGVPLLAGTGIAAVVHLASRVHMMGEAASDVLPLGGIDNPVDFLILRWVPPLGVDAGLRLAAADFLARSRSHDA